MEVSKFIQLLNTPEAPISPTHTMALEEIIGEFPYFQTARALHLRALKNLDSYKYNDALKTTAAHTTNREILFDYITSEEFQQNKIAKTILNQSELPQEQSAIAEMVYANPDTHLVFGEDIEDNPLPQTSAQANDILDPDLFKEKDLLQFALDAPTKKEPLMPEIGTPLEFTKEERHSFSEWLQLTKVQPLPKIKVENPQTGDAKQKKFELLDRFLASNPKIVPKPEQTTVVDIQESTKLDSETLMTETLARVYLEQKKFKKAIQAYKILSLKYPEKSIFFADRIQAVKKLHKKHNKS